MLGESNAQAMRRGQHPLFVQQCATTCRAAVTEGGEEYLPGKGMRRGDAAADNAFEVRVEEHAARDVVARGCLWLAASFRTSAASTERLGC